MLKRTALRRYLLALLWHDGVVQSADCDTGYLWTNCDGERVDVLDHETHQIFENADAPYELGQESTVIIFHFESVAYSLSSTGIDSTQIRLNIDIVVDENSGRKRQDILDVIEERIFYRLFSYAEFTDASTGEVMRSFMRGVDRNDIKIDVRDDSAFRGNYTLRRMVLSFSTTDCIKKTNCDDVALCFDLDHLTRLESSC